MHLANQSSGMPDMLSQGSSKLEKLSQSSMGGTLGKRGSLRPQGQNPETPERILRRDPEKQSVGEY